MILNFEIKYDRDQMDAFIRCCICDTCCMSCSNTAYRYRLDIGNVAFYCSNCKYEISFQDGLLKQIKLFLSDTSHIVVSWFIKASAILKIEGVDSKQLEFNFPCNIKDILDHVNHLRMLI